MYFYVYVSEFINIRRSFPAESLSLSPSYRITNVPLPVRSDHEEAEKAHRAVSSETTILSTEGVDQLSSVAHPATRPPRFSVRRSFVSFWPACDVEGVVVWCCCTCIMSVGSPLWFGPARHVESSATRSLALKSARAHAPRGWILVGDDEKVLFRLEVGYLGGGARRGG